MATKKIPQLAARSVALTGDEELEIAYQSASYRLTTENLFKTVGVLPALSGSGNPVPASGFRIPLYKVSDGQPYSCTLDQALSSAAGTVPSGGTTGQLLSKASNADYDTEWTSETIAAGSDGEFQYNSNNVTSGTTGTTYTPTNRVTATSLPEDTDPDNPLWYQSFQRGGFSNGPIGETDYYDSVWHAGWNWRLGVRVDTNLPAAGLSFESKFYQSGTFASEFHLQGVDTAGGTHRWMSFFLPHGADQSASGCSMTLKYFGLSDNTGVQRVLFDLGNATPQINLNGIQQLLSTNNIPFAKQINAAGNAFITILQLDDYDRVVYGAPVYVNASPDGQFGSVLPINATGLTDGDSIIYAQSSAVTGTLYAIDMDNLSATTAVLAKIRNTASNGSTIFELSNAPGTGDLLIHFRPAYGGGENYSVGVDQSRGKFVIANRFQSFDDTDGTDRLVIDDNVVEAKKPVKLPSFTVAGLPSASTVGAGSMAFVTDATATTPRSIVAGGGTDKVVVFSDATNWLILG